MDSVGLLADLDALGTSSIGPQCLAGRALDGLPEDVRTAVNAFLWNRPNVNTTDIVRVLARHGVDIKEANLGRHRRLTGKHACKCPGKPQAAAL